MGRRGSRKGFVGVQGVSLACISLKEYLCLWQEWDRKAEDARREYEKAMKEYEGGRGDSSKR